MREDEVLEGAFVVLGVSGGIAAYKAVEVCRLLVEAGAHVAPVLTRAATFFVGVATFSALASEQAQSELFGGHDPIPHTRLGRAADLVVVAPATARLIGEHAAGISADLLGATLLATRAPLLLCPAMHSEMWEHPAVKENIATLRRRGAVVLSPGSGRLAGGDVGPGRLAEPEEILAAARELLVSRARRTGDLARWRVLVTAGGTREPLDPVRFIANRSSGRQGHELAAAAAARGAKVVLVTTSDLPAPAGIEVVTVETAAEMLEAVLSRQSEADLVVMAAAVADFRPAAPSKAKLHRADGVPEIILEPTPDILAELGRRPRPGQVLVGFAAETGADDLERRGREKLERKRLDLVVANDVSAPGVGFGHETNAVTLFARTGEVVRVPLGSKRTIADAVLDFAVLLGPGRAREADRGAGSDAGPGASDAGPGGSDGLDAGQGRPERLPEQVPIERRGAPTT